MHQRMILTPLGPMLAIEDAGFLIALDFIREGDIPGGTQDETPLLLETQRQLEQYFLGKRKEFTIPLNPRGTAFQQAVWARLRAIPYGKTATYGQLALEVDRPRASRAVGQANHVNPISISIPCHRCVGANGKLVGYMVNRELGRHFNMRPQGNARAFGFNDEPLIRMRNTAIHPGISKLSDMISQTEDGYYLINTNNGQADTTGEFMFGVTIGYEIKNGRLGRAIFDTTISGVAFEMLKTVDMVSDTVTWASSGFCGKKQPMTVGMGGPELRCQVIIGGK